MASRRLVLVLCLMLGHTSGQQEKCVASVQGVSGKPGLCPSTWIQWAGNCYKATGQDLTWHKAREECVQMGGTMVVPQSDNETQFLLQYGERLWINCNDIQEEGQWECMEGGTEVTFTDMPWDDGEPNDHYGPASENCAVLSVWRVPLGKWYAVPCGWARNTMCKQPVQVVSPKLHL